VVKNRERALAFGAFSFFQKPIDNEELLAAISQALEKKSGEKQAPAPEAELTCVAASRQSAASIWPGTKEMAALCQDAATEFRNEIGLRVSDLGRPAPARS